MFQKTILIFFILFNIIILVSAQIQFGEILETNNLLPNEKRVLATNSIYQQPLSILSFSSKGNSKITQHVSPKPPSRETQIPGFIVDSEKRVIYVPIQDPKTHIIGIHQISLTSGSIIRKIEVRNMFLFCQLDTTTRELLVATVDDDPNFNALFRINPTTGELTRVGSFPGTSIPSITAVFDPKTKILFFSFFDETMPSLINIGLNTVDATIVYKHKVATVFSTLSYDKTSGLFYGLLDQQSTQFVSVTPSTGLIRPIKSFTKYSPGFSSTIDEETGVFYTLLQNRSAGQSIDDPMVISSYLYGIKLKNGDVASSTAVVTTVDYALHWGLAMYNPK